MDFEAGATVISLHQGDITRLNVDAVVNAANSALQLGGGVAGAIRRAGGEAIQAECDRIGGAPVGTAVITSGGNLPARYVIHAVGPRMGEGDEDRKLDSALCGALEVAAENNLESVALPAISTGIFGYPLERAARRMPRVAAEYLAAGKSSLRKVIFCLYDQRAYDLFAETLREMAGKEARGVDI